MSQVNEFARFYSVSYDAENDRVYITFEVMDPAYKEFALRVAQRDDIELIFRGESLDVVVPDGEDITNMD